jgi:transposase
VYDEAVKAELVAHCGKPGASVSRLARECGINANQLTRWMREHRERTDKDKAGAAPVAGVSSAAPSSFVAVPVVSPSTLRTTPAAPLAIALQARLPNGVVLDLREVDAAAAVEVIAALGRVRCSVSTKA